MAKRILYFIGTQYKGKPIFSVRGNIYQPNGIGDALQVEEKDVADLLSKSQIYGKTGRAYQGFTADPHVAAAIKRQVEEGKASVGVPVDATLAEQLRLAVPNTREDLNLEDISLEDLEALLTKKKGAATSTGKGKGKVAETVEKSEE